MITVNEDFGPEPPQAAGLVDWWTPEVGCSASAWVSRVQGVSVTGTGTPSVAADGNHFRGRRVAQSSSAAGGKAWRVTGLSTFLAAGTRPWVYMIARLRATPASRQIFFDIGVAATADSTLEMTAASAWAAYYNGIGSVTAGAADTAVHRFQRFLDGTNANLVIDGAVTQVASTGTLNPAVTAVSFGITASSAILPADASMGPILVYSAKPSAAFIAHLDAWAAAVWGATG